MLELADEADSKSAAGNGVWVQVPPPAPTVYDERVVGGHYINVTEFVIDKIAQDKYMRIATWGELYYLKHDAFMRNFGVGGFSVLL